MINKGELYFVPSSYQDFHFLCLVQCCQYECIRKASEVSVCWSSVWFLSLLVGTLMLKLLDLSEKLGLSLNRNLSVVVRRAQSDVLVKESWAEAVMLTDCDCEIEHTVSALTQYFLCGERSSTAQGLLLRLTLRPLPRPPFLIASF